MKVFSEKSRTVEKQRRKYGKPENKKETLERLKLEREKRENKIKMIQEIKNKNKDEFHFSYYSINKNMVKKISIDKEELKKMLKYVDSEILRCERILEERITKMNKNKHIVFTDDGENEEKIEPVKVSKTEYENYLEELIKKRSEIREKLSRLD